MIKKENVVSLLETKFIKVFDLQYAEGKHYFDATRNKAEDLVCVKSEEEFKKMSADAATCYVVIKTPGEEPKLLLHYEYRFPVGQYLLSIPAGLVDECDKGLEDAVLVTAKREIKEETGIDVKPSDRLFMINPCVFSTPGMTDESNALVGAVITLDSLDELREDGAVGGESFDGFSLVTKEEARKLLKQGTDEKGIFYPMYTWGALMWFVTDMWREEDD